MGYHLAGFGAGGHVDAEVEEGHLEAVVEGDFGGEGEGWFGHGGRGWGFGGYQKGLERVKRNGGLKIGGIGFLRRFCLGDDARIIQHVLSPVLFRVYSGVCRRCLHGCLSWREG